MLHTTPPGTLKPYRVSFMITNIWDISGAETPYVPVQNSQFLSSIISRVSQLDRQQREDSQRRGIRFIRQVAQALKDRGIVDAGNRLQLLENRRILDSLGINCSTPDTPLLRRRIEGEACNKGSIGVEDGSISDVSESAEDVISIVD